MPYFTHQHLPKQASSNPITSGKLVSFSSSSSSYIHRGNMDEGATLIDYKTKKVYKVLNYNWEEDSKSYGKSDIVNILYMEKFIINPFDRFFFSQFLHKENKRIKNRFFVLNMIGRPDANDKSWTGTAFIKMTGRVICSGDNNHHGYSFVAMNNLEACVEIDETSEEI